jgi:hypothetical protein
MNERLTGEKLAMLLIDIQKKYWQFDAREKARLVLGDPLHLPWHDMLRLNHLCCLEILETERGRGYLEDPDALGRDLEAGSPFDLKLGLDLEFWPEIIKKLLSEASPYRPRFSLIWQAKPDAAVPREPDLKGSFMNASVTHFGSLEVIKVDADRRPVEIGFVGLDELRDVKISGRGIFRSARLFYDDGREDEIVWVPLLYGISWRSPDDSDHNGTFTRWVGHVPVEIEGTCRNFGIGIGHQDFDVANIAEDEAVLFGLGSIEEIRFPSSAEDLKSEIESQVRSLNSDQGRRVSVDRNLVDRLVRRLFGRR